MINYAVSFRNLFVLLKMNIGLLDPIILELFNTIMSHTISINRTSLVRLQRGGV